MATNTSSKYNHISKKLIRSGSPTLYQLNMKKESIGVIPKNTYGQKDLNRTNRTILLVGETGTGKSTLINALTNCAMGVKWEDNVWFKIVDEEEKKDQSESQTSDVIVYEIFGLEGETLPYSLTIIDTPGFGDTRGNENDDIVKKSLHDLFRAGNGVHEINVVGLVLKASENRLTGRSRYIFDSVVSLFGNDMEKNIVCLFTHSDGIEPEEALNAIKKANIRCAINEMNDPVHFLFNNSQQKDRTKNAKKLKRMEEDTTEALQEFSEFLEKAAPQNLEKTVEVLDLRIRLPACIQNLQERVKVIELKQGEVKQTQDALKKLEEMERKEKEHQEKVQQTQEALKKHEEEKKNNENFIIEVDEVYKDTQPVEGGEWKKCLRSYYKGATCCKVCEETCLNPCIFAWHPKDSEVMDGNNCCTVCRGKCSASKHVKEKWIYVSKTKKVKKTLQDMKNKYEKGIEEAARAKAQLENLEAAKINQGDTREVKQKFEKSTSGLLDTLKMEMKKLQEDKNRWLEEAFDHVVKLEQIALNADSQSTHVHLDFLIERMKEKRDTEKVEKLEEIRNRLGKDARKGLGYPKSS